MGEESLSFEPQKFFIGVIDLFSILLPGALLAFVLKVFFEERPDVMDILHRLEGSKGWVAFLVASYVLGHLLFLAGSWLDEVYDWLRRRTQDKQIQQLAKRKKTFRWFVRLLVWVVFRREDGQALNLAGKIKEKSLSKLGGKKAINTFQWSKSFLTLESSNSLALVNRLEADSKFFRCFFWVLLIVLPLLLDKHKWAMAAVAAALIPMALWRYMEQRYKATNQAYRSVIILTAKHERIAVEAASPPAGWMNVPASPPCNWTHAGGVVFRQKQGDRKYLLVESTNNAGQWILPKGKIVGRTPKKETELDFGLRQTAIREVHEETGVWADR